MEVQLYSSIGTYDYYCWYQLWMLAACMMLMISMYVPPVRQHDQSGVSILESLKMLCEQTENKRLQDALKEVRISVEKGETLADSMAEHPKVFRRSW